MRNKEPQESSDFTIQRARLRILTNPAKSNLQPALSITALSSGRSSPVSSPAACPQTPRRPFRFRRFCRLCRIPSTSHTSKPRLVCLSILGRVCEAARNTPCPFVKESGALRSALRTLHESQIHKLAGGVDSIIVRGRSHDRPPKTLSLPVQSGDIHRLAE